MIKFFRKIRYDLMRQNKISKYLKYSIGEIILVVIGILIALSINNRNEAYKNEQSIIATLNNLQAEFEANFNSLEFEIKRTDSAIHAATMTFNILNKTELPYSDRELDSLISMSLFTPGWKPSDFILQELKSSGSLNTLEDDALKRRLYFWTQEYNNIKELNTAIVRTNREIINYIQEEGSLKNIDRFTSVMADRPSNFNTSNRKLFYDIRFENELDDKLYLLRRAKVRYKEIKQQTQSLLEHIKQRNKQ